MSGPAPRQVIVDTDPGIDDAMALAYLRASPRARLIALTTVFGNASIEVTTRNACWLARRLGIDAPVHRGAGGPLHRPRLPSPVHVHGNNGLGDIELAGEVPDAAPGTAHEAIIERVRAAPGEVSLLALGPLTNLALALRAAPSIAGLVREVVVMGGAFGWQGRRGNVSPVAEANVHNDPEAADLVFGADWPVTVVGLDVTSRCVLPAARAAALRDAAGDTGRLLFDISRRYEALYREHDGLDGCCLHDVTAAVCLVEPSLFRFETGPIRVVTAGIAVGQTIQRPLATRFPPGAWDHAPPQRSCVDLQLDRVLDDYFATLAAAARPGRPTAPHAPAAPPARPSPGQATGS